MKITGSYEKITQFKTKYEYWFPLITSMIINNKIEIIYVEKEEEIIDYINNLKEEKIWDMSEQL